MRRNDWSSLNALQIGRYAEYFLKMEFTMFGFDVYTAEVDNRGIDFVIRRNATRYFDVQVKSSRNMNYIFFPKKDFDLRENLLAGVVLFRDGSVPQCYLIPARIWEQSNALFVSRDYLEKKSKPEYGLNLSQKNMPLLARYEFEHIVQLL
jgi:hypothetical protein